MRIGCFEYLNTLPLRHGLLANPLWPEDAELIQAEPSALNEAMLRGELDVSGMSASFYAAHQERFTLLQGPTISAFGPVMSVLYLYNPACLNALATGQAPILLTNASATSVTLLQWWWQQQAGTASALRYQRYPSADFESVLATHGNALVIGDRALSLYERQAELPYKVVDLAAAWTASHPRQPVVFGVWAAQKKVAERHPKLCQNISQAMRIQAHYNLKAPRSLDAMLDTGESLLPGVSRRTLEQYWGTALDYGWSEAHLKTLCTLTLPSEAKAPLIESQ